MKVLALILALVLAVYGQEQESQREARAPFFFNQFFNPITLTFYSTVRAISTVTTACFTNTAGAPVCARRRSIEEMIAPSIVESVESTVAPVENVRESRAAQFDPLDAYYLPPAVFRAYYSPYIRGSLASDPVDPIQQRFLLPNVVYSGITLYTATVTSTLPITINCATTLNSCPAGLPPFTG